MPSPVKHTKTTQPVLPRYEVLEPLGEGAVASVYKVRTVSDGSIRALKALKPEQAGTERAIARFEDEYRILGALHHPSLPEVYDYGFAPDGTRYIVMEFVEGEQIDDYAAAHPADLWLLIYQITEALAFIHDHDLLHLDLKPGNVLVRRTRAFTEDEQPLITLIDFGLSYQRKEGGKVGMVGTAEYMSPEIIRGDERITRAADYYALGVILCELVEGRPPFTGATLDEVLRAHLSEKVTFTSRKVEVADLYPWIERFLSKDINERLGAFEDFRRMAGARLGESIQGLAHAYAVAAVESLGLIGKRDVWERLETWAAGLPRKTVAPPAAPAAAALRESEPDGDSIDITERLASASDFQGAIEKDLLDAQARAQAERPERPAPRKYVRYVALAGPPSSGKAFLVEALRGDLLPRGTGVFALGDPAQYEEIVATESPAAKAPARRSRRPEPVDPNAAILDRFVAGWNRLSERATQAGLVVCLESLHELDKERRDFFEYLVRRVELAVSEGEEPGIFFVVGDEQRELGDALSGMVREGDAIETLEIPPPQSGDIDGILTTLRGPMLGAEEKHSLSEYLTSNLGSGGALMMALRDAVAHEALTFELGRWRFRKSPELDKARSPSSVPYYRDLFSELPDGARSLVGWLSCHPAPLALDALAGISGLSEREILDAVDQLRAYRVLQITTQGDDTHLQLASGDVRDAFYQSLEDQTRGMCHRAFIYYLRGRESLDDQEALASHYRQAGMVRDALLVRVRAVRAARETNDLYRVRRLCERGIEDARVLGGDYNERRRRHIERFFIKNLIDADWSRTNYSGVIELVDRYFVSQGKDVPVSLTPRYAASLESAGDFERTDSVIRDAQSRIGNESTETYQHLMLIDANRLHTMGNNKEALELLERIDQERLPPLVVSKYYVLLMLVNDGLGNYEAGARFAELARERADLERQYEDVLRIAYHQTQELIRHARYRDARVEIRKSIRLAARRRAYRSLYTMYFLASVVYHEEGDHIRALRYIEKSTRLSAEKGAIHHLDGYMVRCSLIYWNLGQFSPAIHLLESVRRRVDRSSRHYFYAGLILFELYTAVNSTLAARYASELAGLLRQPQSEYSLGFYHQICGDHKLSKGDYDGSLEDYTAALRLYESRRVEDDAVRTIISMAHCHLAMGRLDHAVRLIARVGGQLKRLESDDIRTAYLILKLNYGLTKDTSLEELERLVVELGVQQGHSINQRTRLEMNETLFRGYAALEKREMASRYFNRYYSQVKETCSNLPTSELVNEFIQDRRFVRAVQMFESKQKKNPKQDSCS